MYSDFRPKKTNVLHTTNATGQDGDLDKQSWLQGYFVLKGKQVEKKNEIYPLVN